MITANEMKQTDKLFPYRKLCMNCRCGIYDHEVEEDDEDIGRIVIGKLFDRPPRTKKEELEYCHGNVAN